MTTTIEELLAPLDEELLAPLDEVSDHRIELLENLRSMSLILYEVRLKVTFFNELLLSEPCASFDELLELVQQTANKYKFVAVLNSDEASLYCEVLESEYYRGWGFQVQLSQTWDVKASYKLLNENLILLRGNAKLLQSEYQSALDELNENSKKELHLFKHFLSQESVE